MAPNTISHLALNMFEIYQNFNVQCNVDSIKFVFEMALVCLLNAVGQLNRQTQTLIAFILLVCNTVSFCYFHFVNFWTCSHFIGEYEKESWSEWYEWSNDNVSRCLTEQRYREPFRAIYLGKTSILKNTFQISGNKLFNSVGPYRTEWRDRWRRGEGVKRNK